MAASQTILFLAMPRSLVLGADTVSLSVLVLPRLAGETVLGAFPDWTSWTERVARAGLRLEFEAQGQRFEAQVDRHVLQPELWGALFNEGTPVRPYSFDDHSGTGVISYSMRAALSTLKSLYQEAGVALALPDASEQVAREGNRQRLRQLVAGLELHWDERRGRALRRQVAEQARRHLDPAGQPPSRWQADALDREGLFHSPPRADAHREVAQTFGTFHHMPQVADEQPAALAADVNADFDFHQGLAGLASHTALLRALGLVFDITLPAGTLPLSPANGFGTLVVTQATPGWGPWAVPTRTPAQPVAYLHHLVGGSRMVAPAPRSQATPGAAPQVLGLLNLDPLRFGLAQVDVDGALHKVIATAEVMQPAPGSHLDGGLQLLPAQHPTAHDSDSTLPSMRSGGIQLYADDRAAQLLASFAASKRFNDAMDGQGPPAGPLFAEDLLRGWRIDVWDAHSGQWRSLHQRTGAYEIGPDRVPFNTEADEGYTQLATTRAVREAPDHDGEFYLHETLARWAGWSLSAPLPGKPLTKHADPTRAIPQDGNADDAVDEPATPFIVRGTHRVLPRSLPRLRFGGRYRFRARAVDVCGNSLAPGSREAELLSSMFALPRDPEGLPYLRFEPVISPLLILRDERGVTGPGSQLDRIVIRTFNASPDADTAAADLTAGDRHLVPPRTTVEMAERLGMFDDAAGTLPADAATRARIAQRDAGEFAQTTVDVAGQSKTFPLEPAATLDALPHLPDPLSRGAALRDLPGTPQGSIGRADAVAAGGAGPVPYAPLDDANPRPGSVTLLPFGNGDSDADWEALRGLRLVLDEPPAGTAPGAAPPVWDAAARTLTVFLPKGHTAVVPLSSYSSAADLRLLALWQWLREHIERLTVQDPQPTGLRPGQAVDRIAHVLQRAVEGGHWMLHPPHLLTLVHAVQQPIGRPRFTALDIVFQPLEGTEPALQTAPSRGRRDPAELAPLTAWRRPNDNNATLLGALQVHGASTGRVDIAARWDYPVDDLAESGPGLRHMQAQVDTVPLPGVHEGLLLARGTDNRAVGWYDPEHDQIAFTRAGERLPSPSAGDNVFFADAAPRHALGDARRHRVRYTATASSRHAEYFVQDGSLDFTRSSDAVLVDVPASARPLAPSVAYVLPTFGWQRQTGTDVQRSVRFGGGLRVYLHRPWFSSGEGELLGVALYTFQDGPLTDGLRARWKPFITQWGMDPIWDTDRLGGWPRVSDLPDRVAEDNAVSLDEPSARTPAGQPGRVDVAGFPVHYDAERQLWFSDLSIDTGSLTYSPFVRLALVRYQPHALPDALVSRVVLADFAQLTPERSALVSRDPYQPRTLRVVVSGVAPRGPAPPRLRLVGMGGAPGAAAAANPPTVVTVRVQRRVDGMDSDLAWADAPSTEVAVTPTQGTAPGQADLSLFQATVRFVQAPQAGRYRLLIEERESMAGDPVLNLPGAQPTGRLIYAETFAIDGAVQP